MIQESLIGDNTFLFKIGGKASMSNYTNDILLAVFFKQDADRSNALFVSFDGLTFYEIGVPYTHSGGANRDPALLYYSKRSIFRC